MDAFRWRAFAVSDCRVFLVFADLTRERRLVLRDAARGFFFGYRLRLDFATLAMPLTALRAGRLLAAGFPAIAPTTPPRPRQSDQLRCQSQRQLLRRQFALRLGESGRPQMIGVFYFFVDLGDRT